MEHVDGAVVGELLHDGMGEVDARGDRRRPALPVLVHAHMVPARVSRFGPDERVGGPTLASMTFADLVRLSRAYVWVLVGCTVLGAVLMVAWTTREPVLYSATSSGLVQVGTATTAGEEQGNSQLAEDKAVLYAFLVSKTPVAEKVVEDLGLDVPPSAIAGRFSASVDADVNALTVTAIGSTPEEARDLATAVVDAVVVYAQEVETGEANPREAPLTRIVPVEEARLPTAPFSPDYPTAAMKGAAGGLGLAYAVLIARRLIDRRIRSAAHVEEATGAAVLGVIPKEDSLGLVHRGVRGDLGRAGEAFRQLRTNLRFVDVDNEPRRIVVTSALAGEGKSTVSANIARLVAQAGTPVLLVDADLRRPMLATTFDIDGAVGLTQALAGDVDVRDVIVESGMANLSLLPAGRIPPNPSELLGSLRMKQLVDELSQDHLVILDAPPLLPVTDAGLLSALCDGALLVQAAGRTQIEQSQQCRRILDQVGGRLLGVVLNKAPVKGAAAIAYGGGYGSYGGYGGYGETTPSETAEAVAAPSDAVPAETDDAVSTRRGSPARP
ncbi:capsular exopolysaccharide biosynthesis protein [Nocardioides flavus (ex Wang et al. 2016)]|uniref:Capsular exopolysaccharide biosynthesis protein n=2 Tax=Nocardioides flavus (ex Wang et al. 2016) TaxID=2058780 RepID=A0ABQ3HEH5_9ACTN|nr:capsular exopolysaccharide biosynthesis protein [Nocardioides flavus (ex Wang et al. 2016)]